MQIFNFSRNIFSMFFVCEVAKILLLLSLLESYYI